MVSTRYALDSDAWHAPEVDGVRETSDALRAQLVLPGFSMLVNPMSTLCVNERRRLVAAGEIDAVEASELEARAEALSELWHDEGFASFADIVSRCVDEFGGWPFVDGEPDYLDMFQGVFHEDVDSDDYSLR